MNQASGQFFFARAFDQFAPMGPALVSPGVWERWKDRARLVTRLNGEVVQDCAVGEDLGFGAERILSEMSRGKSSASGSGKAKGELILIFLGVGNTIPAGTAVMTGTPAGVGMYRRPRRFLRDGDVVEVSIDGIGTLRNRIVFE